MELFLIVSLVLLVWFVMITEVKIGASDRGPQ